MAEEQIAVYRTQSGQNVTVYQVTGEETGFLWRCAACGDHTDWPYSDAAINPLSLVKAAATAHALVCGSYRQQRSAAIATARRYLASP